jgi:chitin synthase
VAQPSPGRLSTYFRRYEESKRYLQRERLDHALLSHKRRHCLQDLVTIGFIDTSSIGYVASSVVLYLSLVFIVGVVAIRFIMAVMFQWFFSWKLGNFPPETYEQRMQCLHAIEDWSNDIYPISSSTKCPATKR